MFRESVVSTGSGGIIQRQSQVQIEETIPVTPGTPGTPGSGVGSARVILS